MSDNQSENSQQVDKPDAAEPQLTEQQKMMIKLITGIEALQRDIQALSRNPDFLERVIEGLVTNPKFIDRLTTAIFAQQVFQDTEHRNHGEVQIPVEDFAISEGDGATVTHFYKKLPSGDDVSGSYVLILRNAEGVVSEIEEKDLQPKLASALVKYFEATNSVPGQIYAIQISVITTQPVSADSKVVSTEEG